MPNMFGGSQDHPEYNPRRLEKNESMNSGILYTYIGNDTVVAETYDGKTGRYPLNDPSVPVRVRKRFERLKGSQK